MRLGILDRGHGLGTKILFAIIRTASRQPVSDIIKLLRYRADFFGKHLQEVTHEAMRGPSVWSVGDRELMAAAVSKTNGCKFCVSIHTAVASKAYDDGTKVAAALSAEDTAVATPEPLRATLQMLRKLMREHTVTADDMRAVLAAGASREQIEDALAVGLAFSTMNRLASTFDFVVPAGAALESGAKYLLAHGYR